MELRKEPGSHPAVNNDKRAKCLFSAYEQVFKGVL